MQGIVAAAGSTEKKKAMNAVGLPQFLQDLITAPPRAGEGVHNWLYRVARQLHVHLPAGDIVNLLENQVQGCGRCVSRKEIEDAVKNSIPCAWQPKGNAALHRRNGRA